MPRAPPKVKKRTTPADDPAVLDTWKNLHKQYLSQGFTKSESYQKIAGQYQTTRPTVYRWLNENARRTHYLSKKNQRRPDRETEVYRLRTAIRFYLYRHLDEYLAKVFENTDFPLSADDVTLRLCNVLESEGKPLILLKNKTLEKIASTYEPPLLEQVPDTEPRAYRLNPRYL